MWIGASTEPRRDVTHTRSPSSTPSPSASSGETSIDLRSPQRRRVAAALHPGVVRVEPATGRQTERELGIQAVDRRVVDHHAERRLGPLGLGIVELPQAGVEEQRARVRLVRARPLDAAQLLEAFVGHPRMHRRERSQFLPGIVRRDRSPIEAQPLRQLHDDPDVVLRVAGWIQRLAHPLHPPLAVRHGPLGLRPRGGRREHHVGELRRLRHEDVLHDQAVQVLEQRGGVRGIGLGVGGVLADHVERAQVAALHRVEHLGEVPSVLRDDRDAPRALEPLARGRVRLDVLEPGELVGDRAHVAAALDVVLPAQRVHAAAVHADVTGQQAEVDQREHVVDPVVMLGDPERPADHRAIRLRVGVRDLLDDLGRHAGHGGAAIERPIHHRRLVGLEPGGRVFDERVVVQVVHDDLARDRVRERDVAPHVDAEPEVAPLGGLRPARVDHDHLRAVVDALEDVVEEDRMRRSRVRSPHQDEIGVLDLLV